MTCSACLVVACGCHGRRRRAWITCRGRDGPLRRALRAYALDYEDPAEVLARLDRKITYFEPQSMATVLYGVCAAPYDQFVFSSAGHLAPLVATPGAPSRQLVIRPDPPLGVVPDRARHSTPVPLAPGSTLCLFTDGLVERRPTPGVTELNNAALHRALGALDLARLEDAEAITTRIIEAALGDALAEDDVALLTLRRLTP